MGTNPPMERWPGRWQTRYDVIASRGDDRDWFRAGHKLVACRQVCLEFFDARRQRRKLTGWYGDDHPRGRGPFRGAVDGIVAIWHPPLHSR